jgi:glycine dehydrogenase subunit 2
VLRHIDAEAREAPELVQEAPHRSSMTRIYEAALDEPDRWAMTWRGWKRKYGERAVDGVSSSA